jgi:HlyD family secretion protein
MNVRTLCLAILSEGPKSGYAIRKLVEDGIVSHFTEASFGSIYPALEKLSVDGAVKWHEERDPGKPPRKVFSITDVGTAELVRSLHVLPPEDEYRSPFLLIASAAPLVSKAHMVRVLDERIAWLRQEMARLKDEQKSLDCADLGGHVWTLEYGLTMFQASLTYLESRRSELEALAGSHLDPASATPTMLKPAKDKPVVTPAMKTPPATLAARIASITAVLMVSAALALSGPATAQTQAAPRPPAITVATAERGTISENVVVTGTFVARDEVQVIPEIDGLAIVELLAEEGDTVRAGQVLARLNREQLDITLIQNGAQIARAQAAIEQSRFSIAEADANRNQANLALARTQMLIRSGTASQDVLDQRQSAATAAEARFQATNRALQVAEADLNVSRAQRSDIELRLSRTEIRARVGGVVSRRSARIGAVPLAATAAEPMFRIIAEGKVELEADVPETTLARLKFGQPVAVEAVGADQRMAGSVRLVSPEITRTTRLGRIRVALPASDRPTIGSFGRAIIETARTEGVLVPLSAVLFQPGSATVQVVRNDAVETRRVTIGLRADGRAEVREGVAAGEQVVTVSGTFLRNGDRVTPILAAR